MPLLDKNGRVMPPSGYAKQKPPPTGAAFGNWAGRDLAALNLPGGGVMQFDLSQLKLSDYRAMTTHYQVNTSLTVLSFMLHQSNWTIKGGSAKSREFATDTLARVWTQLNRGLSQAHWAGYSPMVLEWENEGSKTPVTKIKDLVPEECWVNWKEVDGYKSPKQQIAPKIKLYDGIKQLGWPDPIPPAATLWFPLLMENGDYYGRKILKPAFTSYFFSMLMHLYSNRFFERYGEPTPVARAPLDDVIDIPGAGQMRGTDYMLSQLLNLRNRSAVVLPNDRQQMGDNKFEYEYELEYLESQMRGVDFERYMQRLDEEISLAIFTPVLLMKTADVGSYNLGVGHMQVYLWMMNALNGDRADYINKYFLAPLQAVNFPSSEEPLKIHFTKLDNSNAELISSLLTALVSAGKVKLDLEQLGEMAGMSLTEVKETTTPPVSGDPNSADPTASKDPKKNASRSLNELKGEILNRFKANAETAFNSGKFNSDFRPSFGYKRAVAAALATNGVPDAPDRATDLYQRLDAWVADIAAVGPAMVETPARFTELLDSFFEEQVAALT